MSGRFLTTALLVSVALFCRMKLPDRQAITALVIVVSVGFTAPSPTLRSFADYGMGDIDTINEWGIADERASYYPFTGLAHGRRHVGLPNHPQARAGSAARDSGVPVRAQSASGLFSFFAGKELHLIDLNGRGDALLARLPAFPDPNWQTDHHERDAPEGYVETIESGENRISDPNLAQYYEVLSSIVSGSLFSGERLRAIVRMNLGEYDHLVESYVSSLPTNVPASQVSGSFSNQESLAELPIPREGIRIVLDSLHHNPELEFRLSPTSDYQVIFTRSGTELTRTVLGRRSNDYVARLRLPPGIYQDGYDAIVIHAANPDAAPYLISLDFISE